MTQQQMGMMAGNPQQYYAQQPQAQWTQQQQMQFMRQQQMVGAAPGQRVMVQRVPYPPGTGMLFSIPYSSNYDCRNFLIVYLTSPLSSLIDKALFWSLIILPFF
ncbi:unnamed protein product [Strongylus vulgaris]|uniref:Uncharacterized protein n=1 Tax=Strongylus vulgaris TaxID=40348 RepID=A0A3P7IPC1_STRVU|nr:unnamed protein product [Strongylus vulgaris]